MEIGKTINKLTEIRDKLEFSFLVEEQHASIEKIKVFDYAIKYLLEYESEKD